MRVLVWVVPLGLLVIGLVSAAPDEDRKLADFFDAFLEGEFKERPIEAMKLGDHRFDAFLDDVSAKARAKWTARYRKTLEDLPKTVEYKNLSRSAQIDFEIFQHHLRRELWLFENRNAFETDPRVYNEYISDSVYLLFTQSTVARERAVQDAAQRMALIPRIVAAAKESLKNPPKALVEVAIRQNRGSIAFYESGLYEVAGETPTISPLRPVAAKVVESLKEYQTFLEKELLPRSDGEWRIGEKKFREKLELELNAGMTADEVLKDAEGEAIDVRKEMYGIARQLWNKTNPGKELPPDDDAGRVATIRQVLAVLSKDHGKPATLLADTQATVKAVKDFIAAKDILRLPDPDRCAVIEMPEFQRGFSVAYLNPAPPLDPRAKSIYAVSPPPTAWDARRVESFLEEYNRYMLQVLTIHEGYPGHYVQLEYSNRHPSKLRRVLSSGVFAEGWAVYTERMMLDQGYGNGDLALRLHQLKFYLRAVINAILDYRMHCSNLTDDEALTMLVNGGFQSEGEAIGKISRAKQSSCQLSTYFVGRMAFTRLRQTIEREMGDKFELGRYHEAVLAHGTLPVKYLPEVVRERLKQPR
jgi:uncharacterized protein (DUF885 family)